MKFFLRPGFLVYFLCFAISIAQARPNGQDPVRIVVDSVFGIAADSASVAIRVSNFNDILSMQGSINWDPAKLAFSSVTNFSLPDFDGQSVGATEASQGKLRFLWTPNDGVARNLPDSTIIFRVNFKVLADAGQNGAISISDDPLPVEFGNGNFEVVGFEIHNGNVEIFTSQKDVVKANAQNNTSCDVLHPNGALSASVYGDTANYQFLWYYGNSEKDQADMEGPVLKNSPEGNYTLAVYDTADNVFAKTFSLTINTDNQSALDEITLDSLANQKSCSNNPDDLTGFLGILVNGKDSNPGIHLFWYADTLTDESELQAFRDSYSLTRLDSGQYFVRAVNSNTGCVQYDTLSIADSREYPGSQVIARDDSLIAPDGESFDWYRNDVLLAQHTPYLLPTRPGFYSAMVTNTFQCATNTDAIYFGVTGLEDAQALNIQVYPNPFVDRLTICSDENMRFIQVFNLSGKLVFDGFFNAGTTQALDFSPFPQGIYFLKIYTENALFIKKIVKH